MRDFSVENINHKIKNTKKIIVFLGFVLFSLFLIYPNDQKVQAVTENDIAKEVGNYKKSKIKKLTKYFVVQDFKDIQTDSSDYEVVTKINSYYLMNSDENHNFNPDKNLEWWTLFKAMIKVKEAPLIKPSKKIEAENELWETIKSIVNEKVHAKFLEQTTDILFTAKQYGLFESVDELKVSPTKEQTYQVFEKVFDKKIERSMSNNNSAISRIEFARLFVKEYKDPNKIQQIKHSIEHFLQSIGVFIEDNSKTEVP